MSLPTKFSTDPEAMARVADLLRALDTWDEHATDQFQGEGPALAAGSSAAFSTPP
ncbi:hypothetical protein [Frankia sp. Cr1]|uniref:hypothetical protein n=1 Tax=Frankia sp. Cr1 TaxID=3073931 RepID=UPI002AD4FDBF|nr:hypothetical protein [Frankia sp. Cr1]